MRNIASFFSSVFNPLLLPTYGVFLVLWVSILCYLPVGSRLTVLLVIFGITCILPMVLIALLHNMRFITDKQLRTRQERWIPYIFATLCYVGAAFYLIHVHSPLWLTAFMWGANASIVVACVVNFFWKISAHATGIAGLVALLFSLHNMGLAAFDIMWLICLTIVFAGAVGSSRIALGHHTLGQVLAGYVNGVVCIYFAELLFS